MLPIETLEARIRTGLSDSSFGVPRSSFSRFGLPGSPIAGSHLVREYCAQCNDPIRVPMKQVGKRPVCNRCHRP